MDVDAVPRQNSPGTTRMQWRHVRESFVHALALSLPFSADLDLTSIVARIGLVTHSALPPLPVRSKTDQSGLSNPKRPRLDPLSQSTSIPPPFLASPSCYTSFPHPLLSIRAPIPCCALTTTFHSGFTRCLEDFWDPLGFPTAQGEVLFPSSRGPRESTA